MVIVEIIIGASIIVLSIVYIYFKFVIFNFWRKRGVFYIEPVVPTGNIGAVIRGKKSMGVFFYDAYMKYKDHRTFGMYSIYKPNLVITDLDLVRTVLTKEFGSFDNRGMFYNDRTDPLSSHLFFLSGKKWRNLRVKLSPTFTSGKIKQMFPLLKECSEELAIYLESKAQTGDSVDIKEMFARFTTEVIMSTVFGIKGNCIKDPNNEYRAQCRKIFELKSLWVTLFVYAPQIMDFFSIPLTDRNVTNFYTKIFRESVEYRKAHNIVRYDFMNLLIQLMEKGYVEPDDDREATYESPTISKLTMMEATAQSYLFFIAGFETSATAATFALYELAQHPDIQDKICQEIDEVLAKHSDLTYDALNEMTYLHKVISESMRKYPTIPILNRICTKEINLPTTNIHLPKGTLITIPVLGLHRDPSIYPDPDKFDPERFNTDAIAKRHPYAYLPFGEGPRICIAARFGMMEIKIGLVSLLSRYKFKLHSRTKVPFNFDANFLILAVKGGIHLTIEPR